MATWMSRMAWLGMAVVSTGLLTGCALPGQGLSSWWHRNDGTVALATQPAISPVDAKNQALQAQADAAYRDALVEAEHAQQSPGISGTSSSGGCGGSCCRGNY